MSKYHKGSFTNGYEGYRRRDRKDVEHAIKSSTIVLDTNALLSLYRMDESARLEYFDVLDALAVRIWIPRQVTDEFHRNRISSLDAHLNALRKKSEAVETSIGELRGSLRDFAKLRSLAGPQIKEYMRPFDDALADISSRLANDLSNFDLTAGRLASHDPVLEKLSILLDGKVGEEPDEAKRLAFEAEARHRGEAEIPPGYKDYKNKGDAGLGDCLIWLQMVEHASANKRSILFVSTDVKEDWIRHQCGLTIGPRPELLEDMRSRAGVDYHHITLSELLSLSGKVLEVAVSQNTINQALVRQQAQVRLRELKNQRATIAGELDRVTKEMAAGKELIQMQDTEASKITKRVEMLTEKMESASGNDKAALLHALNNASLGLSANSADAEDIARQIRKLAEKEIRLFNQLRNLDSVLEDSN
ncbi:PIN domain-containing protein [Streptomyces kunmingensis]|uniref:PIN domain-containing protein n=1 Tax=Streptomyces kunmingensis TaxID=68225 RepID=A0ABU6CG18_9ACTN|nr:PIN domain-containing protein [Streptomyces kunmingensis]MEB3963659.1 PIN domain-containing protein [Streptomyces kunmingensis]